MAAPGKPVERLFDSGQQEMGMALTHYGESARTDYDYNTDLREAASAPRTISSAVSRMDGLYNRLTGIRVELSKVSETIGGPRPVSVSKPDPQTAGLGAVAMLNDSADRCYDLASEIEGTLASIQRSLG